MAGRCFSLRAGVSSVLCSLCMMFMVPGASGDPPVVRSVSRRAALAALAETAEESRP